MGIIVEDDREKLGHQADQIRSRVVGKYGSIGARDLLEPRRLLRYHPREAALLGGGLALALGAGAAYVVGARSAPDQPARSPFGAVARTLLVAVSAVALVELAKRALRLAAAREERMELPPMPEPFEARSPSLEAPDVDAFTIKKPR